MSTFIDVLDCRILSNALYEGFVFSRMIEDKKNIEKNKEITRAEEKKKEKRKDIQHTLGRLT